jgi:hypothetical protein
LVEKIMRVSVGLTIIAALAAVVAVVLVGQALLQPNLPLITDAAFEPSTITPNADGSDDVTLFTYSLSGNASVSLRLEAEDGSTYAFREDERRMADDYQVLFSGVVDGFALPDEHLEGEVLRRLIPDGAYTWRLTAVTDAGESAELTGTLVIADGDAPLPELQNFTVQPHEFTPNQDGINDRVQINIGLTKDAELSVYLLGADGTRYFVPERQDEAFPGEAGRHWFDWSGGVDQNADPPPDGTYTVVAEAQDAVGQQMRQQTELALHSGGKPLAQILPQPTGADVAFVRREWDDGYADGELVALPDDPQDLSLTAITMPVGDLLVFRLTIENYSDVPLRTTGPEPGTVYDYEERASTLGWYEASGAWRVGIDCENAISDYPWRWAIGADDNLELVTDERTDETLRYLPAGERSVVWGAVRMTELIDTSNPQACWAGLIHEDVEISLQNSRVGPREVELVESADSD